MKRLYFLILILAGAQQAFSQATNCTQVLRLVRSTYEQGRLHELPTMMEGCLNGVGDKAFNKADMREAYRYLTLAYIYLEEPEKADESMLKLLNTDHFFQINPSLDPAEFIALFNKFRHDPVFRVGVRVGVNATLPSATNTYNIGSMAGGAGKYGIKTNIQFSIVWEKDLTKKIVIAPELALVSRGFTYNNPHLASADENPNSFPSTQDFIIKQSWMDLNVIGQYKLKNTLQLQTYVGIGPGVSYRLGSTNQASTKLGNGFTVTGSAVDDSKSYNQILYSVSVMTGAKLKLGELYLIGDIRYQYGLVNVINKSARTNPELGFDYQGQYNDYKMSNFQLNVGIIYPYFKPKKLIK